MTDLPKISPGTTHYNQVYNYPTSTTLPSIALLRDPTAHRSEHVSKPETALVSEQQSCFCDTLRPMLKDVANAVQELESSVHFKDGGYPNPVSTVQCPRMSFSDVDVCSQVPTTTIQCEECNGYWNTCVRSSVMLKNGPGVMCLLKWHTAMVRRFLVVSKGMQNQQSVTTKHESGLDQLPRMRDLIRSIPPAVLTLKDR